MERRGMSLRKESKQILLDIVEQIQQRLPVKSILRFRLVSKLWRAVSSDASFAHTHLNFVNHNRYGLTVVHDGLLNHEFWTPKPLNNYEKYVAKKDIGLLRSCNGLVCMHENEKIIVFNPATRESVSLPDPTLENSSDWPLSAKWNFGFNPNTNDYKIIHFYDETNHDYNGCKVEVFTLGKDTSWSQIEGGANWVPKTRAINVSGAMY